MEKKTKIGIAILALIVVLVVILASSSGENSFSHEGKAVDAPAENLLPDVGSFYGDGWDVTISEVSDPGPNAVSAVSAIYTYPGYLSMEIVTVVIYVYDTPDNAKSVYEAERSSASNTSDYDKFEQSFKYSVGFHSFYVFQDMNVCGEVYSSKIFTESQWKNIFSDIEGKIHNNAKDIV